MTAASEGPATGGQHAPLHGGERFDALDGLRGVAALIVVVYHFMSAFLPGLVPMYSPSVPGWVDSPIGIFFNGTFSVYVFFVLSGFVLSGSSLRPRSHLMWDCFLRYLRLALPATASILIAWGLLKIFPTSADQLEKVIPGEWLSWTYQGDIPGAGRALQDGFFDIFRHGESQFNNVLWTMQTELIGSLGIYFFFQFVKNHRLLILMAMGVSFLSSSLLQPYLAFVIGSALCLAARRGTRIGESAAVLFFVVGIILGSQSSGFAERAGINDVANPLFELGNQHSVFYPLAAGAVVAGVIWSYRLRAMFSTRLPVFLGKISFPIYLLHVPLIYTIFAAWSLALQPTGGFELMVTVALPFLVVAIAAGWIFEAKVDQPVLRLLKKVRVR